MNCFDLPPASRIMLRHALDLLSDSMCDRPERYTEYDEAAYEHLRWTLLGEGAQDD